MMVGFATRDIVFPMPSYYTGGGIGGKGRANTFPGLSQFIFMPVGDWRGLLQGAHRPLCAPLLNQQCGSGESSPLGPANRGHRIDFLPSGQHKQARVLRAWVAPRALLFFTQREG
jgi:hypothetical protein